MVRELSPPRTRPAGARKITRLGIGGQRDIDGRAERHGWGSRRSGARRALLVGEPQAHACAGARRRVPLVPEENAERCRQRVVQQHDQDHAGRCRVCFLIHGRCAPGGWGCVGSGARGAQSVRIRRGPQAVGCPARVAGDGALRGARQALAPEGSRARTRACYRRNTHHCAPAARPIRRSTWPRCRRGWRRRCAA